MPNVSSFGAQTDNAVVSGTVTDRQMIIPEVPPQGLMSVGPRVTPNFVKDPWSKLRSYNFFDVVKDVAGSSYIAIKPVVPTNTELTDEEFWFKWSDPDAQLNELQEIVKTYNERISQNASAITAEVARATAAEVTKAPVNHASEETVYGVGNAVNYGHLKLANDDTPMTSGANDGVAATPKITSDRTRYIKPEAYGAVGDGVHDDTAAIQAAINSGVPVYISNKIYAVTAPIYIDDAETLYCDGYLKALDTFKGDAVVVIGTKTTNGANVLSLPTGNSFSLKVNCNWQDCDGIHVCSSFGNFYKCVIKNVTKVGLKTGVTPAPSYIIQSAENVYNVHCDNGTSSTAKLYTNTVGLHLDANDDFFDTVTTANITTGIKLKSYNSFGSVHSWISIPELFAGSAVIDSENGRFIAREIYCDGMETALKLTGASAGSKASIRINQRPQNESKPVKVFKHKGGNYDSGPYYDGEFYVTDINNNPIVIHSNDYENGFITARVNGKNIQWVSDDGSIGKLFQTDGVTVGTVQNASGLQTNYLPSGTNNNTFFLASCKRRAFSELTAMIILSEEKGNIYMASQKSDGADAISKFTTSNWKTLG